MNFTHRIYILSIEINYDQAKLEKYKQQLNSVSARSSLFKFLPARKLAIQTCQVSCFCRETHADFTV